MIQIPPRSQNSNLIKNLYLDLSDIDKLLENLEPKLNEITYDEYENALWNLEAQLQA